MMETKVLTSRVRDLLLSHFGNVVWGAAKKLPNLQRLSLSGPDIISYDPKALVVIRAWLLEPVTVVMMSGAICREISRFTVLQGSALGAEGRYSFAMCYLYLMVRMPTRFFAYASLCVLRSQYGLYSRAAG